MSQTTFKIGQKAIVTAPDGTETPTQIIEASEGFVSTTHGTFGTSDMSWVAGESFKLKVFKTHEEAEEYCEKRFAPMRKAAR